MTPTGANPATATTPGSGVAAPGYVLNGADVTGFRGQRVQIVGTFAPQSTTGAAGTAAGSSTPGAATTAPRQFNVQSIHAIGGGCPQ